MNMITLRSLLASALKQGIKFEKSSPEGTGAYDFHYRADLSLDVDGYTITLEDAWCGSGAEGECYRRFVTCEEFSCRVSRLDGVSQKILDRILVKSDEEIAAELAAA